MDRSKILGKGYGVLIVLVVGVVLAVIIMRMRISVDGGDVDIRPTETSIPDKQDDSTPASAATEPIVEETETRRDVPPTE